MQPLWQPVTALPALAPEELQVWRIALPGAESDYEPYTKSLNAAEIDRAGRIRVKPARLQFVVARTALRVLLGNVLSFDPAQVVFEFGAQGKLAVPSQTVHFNLAHTASTVLIAISRNCEIGIDVECIDREVEAIEIARSSFSPTEQRELGSITDPVELQTAFFNCWTRKEAIIKADSRGLSLPLASFNVPVLGEARATPIQVSLSASDSSLKTYYLTDLSCGGGLAAAIALASPQVPVRQFDFPLDILLLSRG